MKLTPFTMSDQIPMRKFKALDGPGKRVYCRGGDVRFKKSEFYETDKPNEINALLRASRVVEVKEGTEPAKAPTAPAKDGKPAETDVMEMSKSELKRLATSLGATEAEMKNMNKEALVNLVEEKKAAKAAGEEDEEVEDDETEEGDEVDVNADFEKNKALLKDKGVDVADDMTAEQAAQLVKDMEGV